MNLAELLNDADQIRARVNVTTLNDETPQYMVRLDWLVANADRIAEAKINPMWSKRVRQARQEDDAAAIRRLVAVLGGEGE
jgi:hypothetical protein